MQQNGLAKLSEEAGELVQVIGKLIGYPELQGDSTTQHPDGTILRHRLEEEMADVWAAQQFVIGKLGLDNQVIVDRAMDKLNRFRKWDSEGD